jgi:oligoribonuclease
MADVLKKPGQRGDDYFVWFDTEYSGLHLETAQLLQVAALITDKALHRVLPPEADIRLIIHLPEEATVSPWVAENQAELVAQCRSCQSVSVDDADRLLADYVDRVVGPPAEREGWRPIMAGNSIHSDWMLARKYLPLFSQRLHYRHLDVTALKIEWQMHSPDREFDKENLDNIRSYFPEACFFTTEVRHDAYYDVQASIAELAFYRRFLLHP